MLMLPNDVCLVLVEISIVIYCKNHRNNTELFMSQKILNSMCSYTNG